MSSYVLQIIFLMLMMGSMANFYNGSVLWSPVPGPPKTENTTWPPLKRWPDKLGSGRDGLSQRPLEFLQKADLSPGDDEILFRRADKYFSKFVNTAILNMFLQILVEAVDSFLRIPVSSDKGPESFDVEIFNRDSPHFRKRAQGQYRVKRSLDSFLSTTILKIWDFIKTQVLFIARLIIPSPVFKLLEVLLVNLVVPLQKVFDLIRSLVVHILKKLFSDPHEDFDDDLNKIMQDFTKRMEDLLKSSKNFK